MVIQQFNSIGIKATERFIELCQDLVGVAVNLSNPLVVPMDSCFGRNDDFVPSCPQGLGNQFFTLACCTIAIGGVIDGCPAGINIDLEAIQKDLNRRKPGQSSIVTQRKEPDEVTFFSGIFEGKTTGTPIGFAIQNTKKKDNNTLNRLK